MIQAAVAQLDGIEPQHSAGIRFQLPLPISVPEDGVLPDFDVSDATDRPTEHAYNSGTANRNGYSSELFSGGDARNGAHSAATYNETSPALASGAAAVEVASHRAPRSMRLPPRSDMPTELNQSPQKSAYGDPVRTLSSLALVLGGFFLFVWIVRRYRVPHDGTDPLFDTVGKVPLLGKKAHIVKFGDRLLLLAKSGNGLEKLAEVTQPQEVERVLKLCRGRSTDQLGRGLGEILKRQSSNNRAATQGAVSVSSLVHH